MPKKAKRKLDTAPRPGRPASPTSLYALRCRKETALARLRELEVGEREGRLVPVAEMVGRLTPMFAETIRIIESSALSESEKFNLRAQLAGALDAAKVRREPAA